MQIGLYSDFFAMQYWRDSFGYIAVIAAVCVYVVGQVVMFFADRKPTLKVLANLREKVRGLELRGFK